MRRVLAQADPGFVTGCLASGLRSGEGLIAQVRDQIDDTDGAPADKRRLVLEQEFAQVLKVLSRERNTLSPIVRQAWDGEMLQTLVRNNPPRVICSAAVSALWLLAFVVLDMSLMPRSRCSG